MGERSNSLAPDHMRNNIDLQNEYLANKSQIEEMFKTGEIVPQRKMFSIEEKDLRPSIEQTPYMQINGIPDHFTSGHKASDKITRNDFAIMNPGYMSPDDNSSS